MKNDSALYCFLPPFFTAIPALPFVEQKDPMNFQIASVTSADFENIAALARIVWQATYPGIITQAQIDHMLAERYHAERLLAELENPRIFWDKAEISGAQQSPANPESPGLAAFSSTLFTEDPGEMKLDKLYVDPRWQRRGVGRRLLVEAICRAEAALCHTLILAVNKKNEPAIAAYQKYGFSVREAVCIDIGNGFVMDDFIMAKALN